MTKLGLLYGFCRYCPIVATAKIDGQERIVILPKPTKINWVERGETTGDIKLPIYELHSDGEPAVIHPLLKLYFHHNIKLPEYIGSVKSSEWKPEWIVTEKNAELRRILIRQIGYQKMCSVLPVQKLDGWREYELIRLQLDDMPVSYQMLKMTCPTTNDVHILRVPPEIRKAEEAITWVNHGLHPDSFIWQC